MDTLSYSAFRINLAKQMDKVNQNHNPMHILIQSDH
jgi:PHD/YefM family antitoxin component YafN of YafNO toxin-antitoxin module